MIAYKDNVHRLLRSIYQGVEKSLDNYLFAPNYTKGESETAIQNCAILFDAPYFIAVTATSGRRYSQADKQDFIEDMRINFADNRNFVIDGLFEYRLDKPVPLITSQLEGVL